MKDIGLFPYFRSYGDAGNHWIHGLRDQHVAQKPLDMGGKTDLAVCLFMR